MPISSLPLQPEVPDCNVARSSSVACQSSEKHLSATWSRPGGISDKSVTTLPDHLLIFIVSADPCWLTRLLQIIRLFSSAYQILWSDYVPRPGDKFLGILWNWTVVLHEIPYVLLRAIVSLPFSWKAHLKFPLHSKQTIALSEVQPVTRDTLSKHTFHHNTESSAQTQ